MTAERTGLKAIDNNQDRKYLYQEETVNYLDKQYYSSQHVVYTLGEEGPVSAVASDSKGSEQMLYTGGGYDQINMLGKQRVDKGGATTLWEYADDGGDNVKFHQSANITYSNLDGIHNGSGTESYTKSGIMTSRSMKNSNSLDETITYQNDGTIRPPPAEAEKTEWPLPTNSAALTISWKAVMTRVLPPGILRVRSGPVPAVTWVTSPTLIPAISWKPSKAPTIKVHPNTMPSSI